MEAEPRDLGEPPLVVGQGVQNGEVAADRVEEVREFDEGRSGRSAAVSAAACSPTLAAGAIAACVVDVTGAGGMAEEGVQNGEVAADRVEEGMSPRSGGPLRSAVNSGPMSLGRPTRTASKSRTGWWVPAHVGSPMKLGSWSSGMPMRTSR